MSTAPFTDFTCRVEKSPCVKAFEFTAYLTAPSSAHAASPIFANWPTAPGGVLQDSNGRPALLHIAPTRWLAPEPTFATLAILGAASAAGAGIAVDVSGKWQAIKLLGSGASRLLASTIDIEAILSGRACAALSLFDCPSVVTRLPEGFAIWVRSSYATEFNAAVARLHSCSPPGSDPASTRRKI